MRLDISQKDRIFELLKGKTIRGVSIGAAYDWFCLSFTDGTELTVDAHIPKYEHHAELDLEFEIPK